MFYQLSNQHTPSFTKINLFECKKNIVLNCKHNYKLQKYFRSVRSVDHFSISLKLDKLPCEGFCVGGADNWKVSVLLEWWNRLKQNFWNPISSPNQISFNLESPLLSHLVSFQQKCCHRFKPVKSGWFWWTAATPTRRQQEQEQLGQADGWLVLRLLMALRQLTHWQFVPWQLVPYLCNTTTRPQGVRGACPLVRAQRQMTWLG